MLFRSIFLDFITGAHDAFVIEDADHLLQARSEGNRDLHRFLMVADGVVRAEGRKMIFTTNLPNVGSIDEALLRPGRCHASVLIRLLERSDCEALVQRLCSGDAAWAERSFARIAHEMPGRVALAAVYRAVQAARTT